jgi:toxin YoeB
MRSLKFTDEAWNDYLFWQGHETRILRRVNELLKVCQRTPFEGIGKPEALKHKLSGLWSRRIDDKNRLVYQVNDEEILVISCRHHY